MGYRSNVSIITTIEGYTYMLLHLASELSSYSLYEDADELRMSREQNYVYMEWFDVKWYDSYKDVRAIVSILKKMETEEVDIPFMYSRIGEEAEDIHTLTHRKLSFPLCEIDEDNVFLLMERAKDEINLKDGD